MTNVDDGQYVLSFQNPKTLAVTASGAISADATAGEFEDQVQGYYRATYDSWIDVTRKSYDAAGAEVEDKRGNKKADKPVVVKRVYEIVLRRLITGVSASRITATKTTTKADV